MVNLIAPIMTEPGGPAWRQTMFLPFALTSRLATGVALTTTVDAPSYETARHGTAALVDAVATHNAQTRETSIFVVNRSLDDDVELVADVAHLGDVAVGTAHGIHDPDMRAANTPSAPNRVGLVANDTARVTDGELRIVLPPASWTAITLR